jgi:hypothetical protein
VVSLLGHEGKKAFSAQAVSKIFLKQIFLLRDTGRVFATDDRTEKCTGYTS